MDEEGNMIAEGELIAYRGLFLIDKEGVVKHQLVNDLPQQKKLSLNIKALAHLNSANIIALEVLKLANYKLK